MQHCPQCNAPWEDSILPICWRCGYIPRAEDVRPPLADTAAGAAQDVGPAPAATSPSPAAEHPPAPADQPRGRWTFALVGLAGLAAGVVALLLMMARPSSNVAASSTTPPSASAPAKRPASAVEVEEAPAWIVPRRVGYASDGSRTITLQLAALHDLQVRTERIRPVLSVRCLSRRTDVFVALGTPAKPEEGDDHTVSVQFDDEQPAIERWAGSVSYQELFATDGLSLARRLARTRLWRFTFTPYGVRPVVAEFNVEGFDRHVATIARTCGWPAQQGSRF